jgi:hypothetical protein
MTTLIAAKDTNALANSDRQSSSRSPSFSGVRVTNSDVPSARDDPSPLSVSSSSPRSTLPLASETNAAGIPTSSSPGFFPMGSRKRSSTSS